jgi:HlyD family secretion protein
VTTEEIRAAQFATQIASFELKLARAALVRTQPTAGRVPDAARFEIRAPFDGRILHVFQASEAGVPLARDASRSTCSRAMPSRSRWARVEVVDQRIQRVIWLVDPPERREILGDAFRVEARIVIWEGDDMLKVSARALLRRGDGCVGFTGVRGKARMRPVRSADATRSKARR